MGVYKQYEIQKHYNLVYDSYTDEQIEHKNFITAFKNLKACLKPNTYFF